MNKNVYVIAEQRDGIIAKVSFELISEATKLATVLSQKVVAVLIGDCIKDKAQSLIENGADSVIVVENSLLKEYTTEPYTKAVAHIIKKYKPEILLYAATSIGRDLAPRVASRIHTGLTADCTKLDIDTESQNEEKLLLMTRPAFGGNIMATIICKKHRPQMATVRPGVMKRIPIDTSRKGEIIIEDLQFSSNDINVEIREIIKEKTKKVDITEAKRLISGGRGIGSEGFFSKLQEIADLLDGEISSTRANVDSNWIERDRQVGQTGKTVRPELYLACGISGAIQHVAGMEGSECIISINKNDTAPIFEISDLGILGDVKEIIPKLAIALKKYKTDN